MKVVRPPRSLWLAFGIAGGVLGALNPAWYLAKADYARTMINEFGFDYDKFAVNVAGFYLLLLFIPALLSTLILYPGFYVLIKSQIERNKNGMIGNLVAGLGFGCIASLFTAFFFLLECLIYGFFTGHATMADMFLSLFATPVLALAGVCISFPGMCVSGWLFATATAFCIRKQGRN